MECEFYLNKSVIKNQANQLVNVEVRHCRLKMSLSSHALPTTDCHTEIRGRCRDMVSSTKEIHHHSPLIDKIHCTYVLFLEFEGVNLSFDVLLKQIKGATKKWK